MPTDAYILLFKPFEGGTVLGIYSTVAKAEKQAGRFIAKYNKKHSTPMIEGGFCRGPLVAESENWYEFKAGEVCVRWTNDWDALYILRCDMDATAKWDSYIIY